MNSEISTVIANDTPTGKAKRSPLRVAARIAFASLCALGFGFTVSVLLITTVSSAIAGKRDFVSYWADGQLLVRHLSPYDGVALGQIEHGAGYSPSLGVMYMLSPPWTLPILYPLGFLSLQTASILWAILEIACFVVSIRILRRIYGGQRGSRHYLGYAFAPALICLTMGQLTVFALLGLVLFLRFYRTRPFAAGVALWLCTLKFHLFLPFGVVLLAWAIVSRSYRVISGTVLALAMSVMIALPFVQNEWTQYLHILHSPGSRYELAPCLSVLFRVSIDQGAAWLQYMPSALACIWALRYFWTRRAWWDWKKHGSLLMLVSILVAPHTYLYDQVLAIPALLEGVYATRSRNLLAVLALLSVLIEAALLAIVWRPAALYDWTLWSAPAWIAWYVMASAKSPEQFGTATAS